MTLRVDKSKGIPKMHGKSQEGGHAFILTLIGFPKIEGPPLKEGPKNVIGPNLLPLEKPRGWKPCSGPAEASEKRPIFPCLADQD